MVCSRAVPGWGRPAVGVPSCPPVPLGSPRPLRHWGGTTARNGGGRRCQSGLEECRREQRGRTAGRWCAGRAARAARAHPGERASGQGPRAKPRTWRGAALAKELPVARVLVDKGVLHLDRYFDYAVPEELDADAQPGVRVRVRFGAGRHRVRDGRREGGGLIDGFLVERLPESDYAGPLAALAQVVSPEQVLDEELLGLVRAVADRYAGSLADVLQLAVPPRNARAEQRPSPDPLPPPPAPAAGSWERYDQGPAFLESLASGGSPAPCGTRCRDRGGARRSPGRSRRRCPRGAAHWSSCPTDGPSHGSTPRSPTCWGRPARGAHRRRRTGEAVRAVARRTAGSGARGDRDPGGDVRPGARPRAGRRLGRRGRQPQ